jgi:hypothetical protein
MDPAYFVVIIILLMFVFILSGCYIKQIKSEKFHTPRLQLMREDIPPTVPPTTPNRFDQSKFMPIDRKPF